MPGVDCVHWCHGCNGRLAVVRLESTCGQTSVDVALGNTLQSGAIRCSDPSRQNAGNGRICENSSESRLTPHNVRAQHVSVASESDAVARRRSVYGANIHGRFFRIDHRQPIGRGPGQADRHGAVVREIGSGTPGSIRPTAACKRPHGLYGEGNGAQNRARRLAGRKGLAASARRSHHD